MNVTDIEARIVDEGRIPLVPLVHVHELSRGGLVMRDDHVKVTSALVDHPPLVPSFAFRFDAADRSLVISGDTARSDKLIKLAQGADVLVTRRCYSRLSTGWWPASRETLKKYIIAGQTSVEDAGQVAQAAGVKTLVLSHLIPPDDPPSPSRCGSIQSGPISGAQSSSAGICWKSSTWLYGFACHPAKSSGSSSISACNFRSVVQVQRIVSRRST